MLIKAGGYDKVCQSFKWRIPERYNIGLDVCDKWAQGPDRTALIHLTGSGEVVRYGFGKLKELSDRLANGLKYLGLARGDRVGILLPQGPETALTHLAAYKLGGVAVPLFTLFGAEALAFRLGDSGARMVVTDQENLPKVLEIKDRLPELEVIVALGGGPEGVADFGELVQGGSPELKPAATLADDPALIIYTSGTTGPPKGALHAHRVLPGHLPGVELPHGFPPQAGDLFWTPADWAWIGGLMDVLFPAWSLGVPVLAFRAAKFDPEEAYSLMARFKVANVFMPATALKLLRQVPSPRERFDLRLRSLASGGETLGTELLDWGREELGVEINEFYGQTEANLLVSNCAEIMEIRPGSMGRAVPGHTLAVVDREGRELEPGELGPGELGQVAVKRPDPVMFLGYWNNPEATRAKFAGDWLLTGDQARRDGDGYFWFVGRDDDVITSAGYRIGPGEVEDCLSRHPAVKLAAVIGRPDPVRTQIVKAFVVLKEGVEPGPDLAREIQEFVKTRLAAHEYPREVEFIDELPVTATGKIKRLELKKRELEKDKGRKGGG